MSTLLDLARPELLALRAYRPARYESDRVRMNANEAPWRAVGDTTARGLNIYPPPRPAELTAKLAETWSVPADEVLVTRGSSEAIDLLVRAFCVSGRDHVIICPPTFGMYRVYAAVQGAAVREVALRADAGFALDVAGIEAAVGDHTKLLFLCSPNNPTGHRLASADIARACEALAGRGLVVLDEAYVEFADGPSLEPMRERYPHLVVLRTLSKAQGLAGARCGALIGASEVVDLLQRILPPYALATPTLEAALASLAPEATALMAERIAALRTERTRVAAALAALPTVDDVLPSETNFLLVRATDPARLVDAAYRAGILIRDFSDDPHVPGSVRISIGTQAQNDTLLAALQAPEARAHG